jgi:hypothetical protein
MRFELRALVADVLVEDPHHREEPAAEAMVERVEPARRRPAAEDRTALPVRRERPVVGLARTVREHDHGRQRCARRGELGDRSDAKRAAKQRGAVPAVEERRSDAGIGCPRCDIACETASPPAGSPS